MKRTVMVIGGMLGLANVILGVTNDPAPKDYIWGKPLGLAAAPREVAFKPDEEKANFTFFDGVADVRVEAGALKFTLATNQAVLGWGNYLGKQSPAEMAKTPENWSQVALKVKQSVPKTDWSLRCWRDGKRDGNPIPTPLATNGWAELKFDFGKNLPPDGLEIEISGAKGATLEIAQVKAVSPAFEGYFRKEFILPDAKVWQALAQIGGWGEVFINGQPIERRKGAEYLYYGMEVVDIRSFLKPGQNLITVHSLRWKSEAYFLLQCRIALESGEIISLPTDETWKMSPKMETGWDQSGFDDSKWAAAPLLRGYLPKYLADYFTSFNAHHGLGAATRLRNPDRKEFFYGADANIQVDVLVPAGLKDKAPVIEYVFANTDKDGKSLPVKEDKVTAFDAKDNSLAFHIDCGRQPAGVYTLAVTLKTKDGIVEERWREPLMVLRKFDPKVVEGKDYFDGLDTEIEDTIDFTNPQDPHPWFSARPGKIWSDPWSAVSNAIIVTTNGLTYRETGSSNCAVFAYRIEFKHPGSWYLLELEYPDDAERHVLATINPTRTPVDPIGHGNESWSEAGVGYYTGGRYYTTGQMQKLHWLHGADSGAQVFTIQNYYGRAPGAAKSLKIYRVKNELPSIGGGTDRQFGILTERCTEESGFAHNFGADVPEVPQGPAATAKYTLLEQRVRFLRYLQEAAEKYAQYLKFSGQNAYIMGMFQYSEGNTAFTPPYAYDTVEIMPEMKTVLANVLDRNGVNLYLNFQFCTFDSLATTATDAEVARGADTVWRVNEFGEQKTGGNQVGARLQNWMHPKIEARFHEIMRQFAAKFGHLKAFKGIRFPMNLATGMAGYYMPGLTEDTSYQTPFMWSYDDATFAQFEKDSGIQLQIAKDDPQRFQKRTLAIKNPAVRERYRTWRCEAFRNFLAGTLAALRAKKPEAGFILDMINEHDDLFRYWRSTGRDYGDWLKDYAVDVQLLNATPGFDVGRWTLGQPSYNAAAQSAWMELPKTDPEITALYSQSAFRHVQVRTSWDESFAASGGGKYGGGTKIVADNWIPNYMILRALPQLSGYNAREGFIQTLITGDPNSLMAGFTDINLNVGHEQEIRDLMKIVTCLPKEKFSSVLNTGLDSNLAIRQLAKAGRTYIYVANPGYWFIKGSLTLVAAGDVLDFMTGRPVSVEKKDGKVILPVELSPYGLAAFVVGEPLAVSGLPSVALSSSNGAKEGEQSKEEKSKIQNPAPLVARGEPSGINPKLAPPQAGSKITIESFETGAITERELAHMQAMAARVRQLMDNPEIQLVLGKDDAAFMRTSLKTIDQSLADRQYARAWSILTSCRFWLLWKNFLEKAEQGLARLPAVAEKEPVGMRVLVAATATEPITLDGKLDEQAWQKTRWSADFLTKDRLPGMAETAIKALHDQDNLYLAFMCADRDMQALKGGEGWTWADDELVVFLQPDETRPIYFQLGFNTAGIQFHQKVMAGERIYDKLPGWKSAIATQDTYWVAEAVYPFATLGLPGKGAGRWRLNCHRVVRDNRVDNASWYQVDGPWHEPANGARQPFGRLVLE